jgi:hypothetical protein
VNQPREPGSYRGSSKEKRNAVGLWQNREFRAGRLTRPTTCCSCGLSGPGVVIIAHLEDYDRPTAIDPLCVRCHLVLHSRYKRREAWERYRAAIRAGAVFPAWTHATGFGGLQTFLRALETRQRGLLSEYDAAGFTYGPKRGPGYLDTITD